MEASTRFGIRYRLSVVLLLATLNSIAMAAVAIVLFSAVAESPPSDQLTAVLNAQGLLSVAHDTALTADLSDQENRDQIENALKDIEVLLAQPQTPLASVGADFMNYRTAMREWVAEVAAKPGIKPENDPAVAEDLAALRRAHRYLNGSMQLAVSYPRPQWVEQAIPMLPWFMAWVVMVGAITMVGAWSLRTLLSRPLDELSNAAERLAAGDLNVDIPLHEDSPEIAVLGRAMRSARDSLLVALQDREARSAREQAIVAHMSDGILLLDHQGKVVQLNPKAEQLLWQLIPIGVEPRVGHQVWRLIKEIEAGMLEGRNPSELDAMRTVPGATEEKTSRTWVHITLRPVPSLSKEVPGGWVVMLRDVTTERELDQLQRQFLSVVTHELKTPLTAIEGYARLLLRGKAGKLEERQQEFVQTIADQGSVLKHMVQNLLDTSRLEDGRLPIDKQRVSLERLLKESHSTWMGGADTHGVELAIELTDAGGVDLRVDPFRLQQVIGNLVGNALKFTERGGRITLRGTADDVEARIEVEDTGRGITPDKLDRVFDKFFQVERGDTRVAGGTGLGLFICKQLVEAMGGTISVRSQDGVGSCFILQLPIAEGPVTDHGVPAPEASNEPAEAVKS